MHAMPRLPRFCSRVFLAAAAVLSLASAPAHANEKYAGYVYDVNAGKVLYEDRANEERYPASLTKIMTCYIIFEELKAGRMSFGTQMNVSAYAAGRPPSKIGFRPGQTIEVRDAIKALVTKSANDVAVVVAEHIAGSETAFARRMTQTAHRLGMKSTIFRNANGLPDPDQHTTARDMTTLGIAIQRDFPQYYGVFQTRVFEYGKRRYGNHNKLLGRVEGVDGIKTGYIRAAGFNLVTSIRRDGRHIVATVMGGNTGASRDAHMKELVEKMLPKAQKGSPMPLMAYSDLAPPPLPLIKPALAAVYVARFNAKTEEKSPIEAQILAFAADTRAAANANSIMAPAAADPETLTAVIAQAAEAGLPAPANDDLPATAIEVAAVDAALVSGKTAMPAKVEKAVADVPDRFSTAFAVITVNDEDGTGVAALLAAIDRTAIARRTDSRPMPAPVGAALQAEVEMRRGVTLVAGPAPVRTNEWQIQLGAVGTAQEADALLSAATEIVPAMTERERLTVPVTTTRGTLYRARFAGFASQSDARAACQRFANQNRPCWAVSM